VAAEACCWPDALLKPEGVAAWDGTLAGGVR